MKISKLQHKFVKAIPDKLEDGVLYISPDYRTMTHKCCCGCGFEVVTPLGPTDWSLTFDGVSVSLQPSVGNWSLACQSHYWIQNSVVRWSNKWSDRQIREGRLADQKLKDSYYNPKPAAPTPAAAIPTSNKPRWKRFLDWFVG